MVQAPISNSLLLSKLSVLLLTASVIILFVKPTNSSIDGSSGNENSIADAKVQKLIQQLYQRKGYSNPSPVPSDYSPREPRQEIIPRRTRRPLRRIDENFNPNNSYVIKAPDGRLTYVFPNGIPSTIAPTKRKTARTTPRRTTTTTENLLARTYPTETIDALMNRHREQYIELFGSDLPSNQTELNNRFDDSASQKFFCDSETKVWYPQFGKTEKNLSVLVVNTKQYQQGVQTETCKHVGKSCNIKYHSKTKCVQIYYYRTLVTFDIGSNKFFREKIELPSGCKCAELTAH